MLRTIIIGFGHAARSFHLPAVRRRGDDRLVGVVDPLLAGRLTAPDGVRIEPRLDAFDAAFPPDETVVHVCTPPGAREPVLRECATAGYRRFIVEKPLADSRRALDAIRDLADAARLDVLVVANWLASRLTDEIAAELEARAGTPVAEVELRNEKPRIGLTLASASHRSAFEVEMPHLLALALRLWGPFELLDASASDLAVGDRRVPLMGSAEMRVVAPAGHEIRLATDLRSPARSRSATVTWADGTRLVGHYPCGSTDLYSHLRVEGPDGRSLRDELFDDDTVRATTERAYAWFEGRGPRPPSDLRLHLAVTDLLLSAAERAAGSAPTAAKGMT
jgi:predicted dehydrogenase